MKIKKIFIMGSVFTILYLMSGFCLAQNNYQSLEAKLRKKHSEIKDSFIITSRRSDRERLVIFITKNNISYVMELGLNGVSRGQFSGSSAKNIFNILNSNDDLFMPHNKRDKKLYERVRDGFTFTLNKGDRSITYWYPTFVYVLDLLGDQDVDLVRDLEGVVKIWYELRKNISYFRNEDDYISLSISFEDYISSLKKQMEVLKK